MYSVLTITSFISVSVSKEENPCCSVKSSGSRFSLLPNPSPDLQRGSVQLSNIITRISDFHQ